MAVGLFRLAGVAAAAQVASAGLLATYDFAGADNETRMAATFSDSSVAAAPFSVEGAISLTHADNMQPLFAYNSLMIKDNDLVNDTDTNYNVDDLWHHGVKFVLAPAAAGKAISISRVALRFYSGSTNAVWKAGVFAKVGSGRDVKMGEFSFCGMDTAEPDERHWFFFGSNVLNAAEDLPVTVRLDFGDNNPSNGLNYTLYLDKAELYGSVQDGFPVNSYLAWAEGFGLELSVGSSTNDPDGDGLSNLSEYAVGGNPLVRTDRGLPVSIAHAAGGLVVVHPQRADDFWLDCRLERSGSLAPAAWIDAGGTVLGIGETSGPVGLVSNRVDAAGSSGFFRLAVTYPHCLTSFIPIPYADFSVIDYGAAGDGEVDDTAAIQAAITAAEAARGTVWFPSGLYRITSPLILRGGASLLGRDGSESPCASIIQADANMAAMVLLTNSLLSNPGNLAIENLVFDGGAAAGRDVDLALDLQDFIGSRVAGVTLRNVTGDGIWSRYVQSPAGYSWVNWFVNLDVSCGGYALRLGSSDSWVLGVNVNGGLGMYEDRHSGNVYRNCAFNGCADGITFDEPAGNSLRTSVAECTFTGSLRSGIFCTAPTASFSSYVSVDRCVFDGSGQADVLLDKSGWIALYGNEFRTAAPSSGQAIHTTGTVDYVSVTDNRFASAGQTVPGSHSVMAGNLFSVTNWSAGAGTFPREDVILLPTGGRVLNVMSFPFNALGNGKADDTAKLQAALDAATSGDTVYLPAGAYRITAPLNLRTDRVTILGDGPGLQATRILAGVSLDAMLTTPVAVSGIRMAKLQFAGAGSNTVDNALMLTRMTDSRLDRVQVTGVSGNAVYVGSESARITLQSCHLQKPKNCGLILEGSDCAIDGCYISCEPDVTPYGIQISGPGGHQILSTHVDIETSSAILLVNPSVDNKSVLVRNCYFDCGSYIPPNAAIQVDYDQPHAAKLSVESCLFRSNARDLDLHNATHVTLKSCTSSVRNAAQGGTIHLKTSGTVNFLTVAGNVFANPVSVPGASSTVYGNATP